MADYVIVGGGVYGSALAFLLAKRGADVVLVEARDIGAGASSGPGQRGVRANGRDVRELPLIRRAHEMWPDLHTVLGVDPLFERTGHLMLIERQKDLARAEQQTAVQNALGTKSSLLDASAVRDLEPHVAQSILGAVLCPDDGVADHTATTRAYAAAAQAVGARLEIGGIVKGFDKASGRVRAVVLGTGERIDVSKDVFVMANAGVADLIPWLALAVWNLALQVLVSATMEEVPVRHLVGHAHRTLALKAEADNKLMISGGHEGIWDPETHTGQAVPDAILANLADATAVYPGLNGLSIEVADVSHLESMSIDGIPIIDRCPGLDNMIFATGWCGHGWAIAPAVAEALVDWVLDDDFAPMLAPFSYRRFGDLQG